MHTVILDRKYDHNNALFALCVSCYWTATIFIKIELSMSSLSSNDIVFFPLNRDEKYEYQLEPKTGTYILNSR